MKKRVNGGIETEGKEWGAEGRHYDRVLGLWKASLLWLPPIASTAEELIRVSTHSHRGNDT